jgi:hypothetical protein
MTLRPTEDWMEQMAWNLTDVESGALHGQRYILLYDDAGFSAGLQSTLRGGRGTNTPSAELS